MSRRVRYAPLPTTQQDHEREMEDAFEGSDDEHDAGESQPMISQRSLSPRAPSPINNISNPPSQSGVPLYDFEYDYPPPPGSPPRPSALALPGNIFGNNNGYIPVFSGIKPTPRQGNWFTKTIRRWLPGRSTPTPGRPVGGGTQMDGVFTNVVAKPTTMENPRALEEGTSNVHIVPEFEQNDVPPSYAAAQADAVPPYWETTVHAPSLTDMEIEGLPSGHFFAFVTNFFVSVSFQFVGFIMTSVLASTHAARFGSRAGLGATLIQTGYYMTQQDNQVQEGTVWPTPADVYDASKAAADAQATSAPPGVISDGMTSAEFSAVTQWLSFFLMAVGWLVLLSSILGFWRVKRFERSIQQSNARTAQSNTGATPPPRLPAARGRSLLSIFAVPEEEDDSNSPVLVMPEDPEERRRVEWAIQEDQRLQADLRAAGLL